MSTSPVGAAGDLATEACDCTIVSWLHNDRNSAAARHIECGWRAQTLEYRFAAPRRWRFDVAWPDAKVAVEFQGQHGPAHRGYYRGTSGLQLDCEKFCAAAADGWRLFPVTYPMLREDMAGVVELVARAVDNRREG